MLVFASHRILRFLILLLGKIIYKLLFLRYDREKTRRQWVKCCCGHGGRKQYRKDPLQTDPQQAEDPWSGTLAGGAGGPCAPPGHEGTDRIFCGTAPPVDPAAPGKAGTAEAAGGGASPADRGGAAGTDGAARRCIPERVRYYAPKVGVDYCSITIRCQKFRWGSCSGRGNLSFNCLLMLTPPEVIDSVVVHELCHRKEMNHSAAFYAHVLRVFPEYRTWPPLAEGKRSRSAVAERDIGGEAAMCPPGWGLNFIVTSKRPGSYL